MENHQSLSQDAWSFQLEFELSTSKAQVNSITTQPAYIIQINSWYMNNLEEEDKGVHQFALQLIRAQLQGSRELCNWF